MLKKIKKTLKIQGWESSFFVKHPDLPTLEIGLNF
jgi:hypothetical protein